MTAAGADAGAVIRLADEVSLINGLARLLGRAVGILTAILFIPWLSAYRNFKKRITQYRLDCKQEFFELFSTHFYDLWD